MLRPYDLALFQGINKSIRIVSQVIEIGAGFST